MGGFVDIWSEGGCFDFGAGGIFDLWGEGGIFYSWRMDGTFDFWGMGGFWVRGFFCERDSWAFDFFWQVGNPSSFDWLSQKGNF